MTTASPGIDPAESTPDVGSDEMAKLLWLTEKPGRAFMHLREVSDTISSLFGKAESAAQRDSLLHMFFVIMAAVDGMLSRNDPAFLDEFRNANRQSLKTYWVQESLVDGHVDGKTLVAVSRREKARHRMAANCEPMIPGRSPIASISERELLPLNAAIDRQRLEAAAGRHQGTQTVLLYPVPGFPDAVGISRVDPPVEGGAFMLDFSAPLHVTKSFLGKRNSRFGTDIELRAPIIHQGQNADDPNRFSIPVQARDPRFSQIRTLWKERYPAAAKPTGNVVSGIKVLVDFYTQFPDS